MKKSILSLLAVLAIFTGCSRSDPGPLAGTWRMAGLIPMTVQFRPGEAETMGLIEKVSYEVRGNEVIVRYETGPMQGTAVRFTMTGPNSARSGFGRSERNQLSSMANWDSPFALQRLLNTTAIFGRLIAAPSIENYEDHLYADYRKHLSWYMSRQKRT